MNGTVSTGRSVVLEELQSETFVSFVRNSELESDPHKIETEHAHPPGAIGLFQHCAAGQLLTAVDHGDVVKTEKSAFENIVPCLINLVHPPGEIDQQLMKALFEKLTSASPCIGLLDLIDTPNGPGVKPEDSSLRIPIHKRESGRWDAETARTASERAALSRTPDQ